MISSVFHVKVIGVLCVCTAAAVVVWKWKRDKKSSPHSSTEGRKFENLDEKKAEHQENLQKINDKLDSVEYKMINLMKLKKILENQREQFKLQLEDVERERQENKDKLQSVMTSISKSEKEKETDKTEGYFLVKQGLLNDQWRLEKRKEELEKLQLETEKLLQSKEVEDNVGRITERRKELENHKQQLNDQLHRDFP